MATESEKNQNTKLTKIAKLIILQGGVMDKHA